MLSSRESLSQSFSERFSDRVDRAVTKYLFVWGRVEVTTDQAFVEGHNTTC